MASRSFKPASYLASAAQQPKPHGRSPRPSFTRSSSSSSNLSTKSEDSLLTTLKALSVLDKEDRKESGQENTSTGSPHYPTPGNGMSSTSTSTSQSFFDNTPGRKRSQPIAIELPARDQRTVYTPLSARGDLPGGYFPNHEEITRSYKSHPFSSHHEHKQSSTPDSPSNMSASSLGSPVSDTTPRGPQSLLSPVFVPEALTIPMGKYHPSNYKSTPTSSVTTPTAFSGIAAPFPSTNLAIPNATRKRSTSGRPGHERKSSDVKRKIQQYQRDMISQARFAGVPSGGSMKTALKEPSSPRLLPAGSPGPITPFELEESAGYLMAGTQGGGGLIGSGNEREREREMETVERMIKREKERRQSPVASPVARV